MGLVIQALSCLFSLFAGSVSEANCGLFFNFAHCFGIRSELGPGIAGSVSEASLWPLSSTFAVSVSEANRGG